MGKNSASTGAESVILWHLEWVNQVNARITQIPTLFKIGKVYMVYNFLLSSSAWLVGFCLNSLL